jgi:hypothetical protein
VEPVRTKIFVKLVLGCLEIHHLSPSVDVMIGFLIKKKIPIAMNAITSVKTVYRSMIFALNVEGLKEELLQSVHVNKGILIIF